MTPPSYHGACSVCGALYYWRQGTAPKNWRKPDDLEGALVYARLECDHVMSQHAPLWRDEPARPSEPPRTRMWP